MGPFEGGAIIFITSTIVWPQVQLQGGNTAGPSEQDPVLPTVSLPHQEASISLLSFSIRGHKSPILTSWWNGIFCIRHPLFWGRAPGSYMIMSFTPKFRDATAGKPVPCYCVKPGIILCAVKDKSISHNSLEIHLRFWKCNILTTLWKSEKEKQILNLSNKGAVVIVGHSLRTVDPPDYTSWQYTLFL